MTGVLLVRLADHHSGGVHELAVSHHPNHELGDVDVDVELPEVMRQPAPALHVQQDQPRPRGACSLLMLLIEQAPRAWPHTSIRQHATGFLKALNGGVHRSIEYGFLVAILDRNVETLAKKSHLLVVDAELERRAVRDAHQIRVGIATTGSDQSLAQSLELRLVGLEATQVSRRVRAEGDRFDHFHRIW